MSALTRALCAPALAAVAAAGASAQDGLIGSWPVSAAPPGNPFLPGSPQTDSEIELGAMLFWDSQLSADGTMACGTCHIPKNGGADSRPPGFNPMSGAAGSFGMLLQDASGSYVRDPDFGFNRQVTEFSAPTVIGSSFFGSLFWDKRVDGSLEDEAGTTTEPVSRSTLRSSAGGHPTRAAVRDGPRRNSMDRCHDSARCSDAALSRNQYSAEPRRVDHVDDDVRRPFLMPDTALP